MNARKPFFRELLESPLALAALAVVADTLEPYTRKTASRLILKPLPAITPPPVKRPEMDNTPLPRENVWTGICPTCETPFEMGVANRAVIRHYSTQPWYDHLQATCPKCQCNVTFINCSPELFIDAVEYNVPVEVTEEAPQTVMNTVNNFRTKLTPEQEAAITQELASLQRKYFRSSVAAFGGFNNVMCRTCRKPFHISPATASIRNFHNVNHQYIALCCPKGCPEMPLWDDYRTLTALLIGGAVSIDVDGGELTATLLQAYLAHLTTLFTRDQRVQIAISKLRLERDEAA